MRATINGRDYVLLKDEAMSLGDYLQIQKYRYGDRLESTIRIDSSTEQLYVPKLIIQPLVENAIYHGVDPAFESGCIEVKSAIESNDLLIFVVDNGVGMTPDTIRKVLDIDNRTDPSTPHSIGLQNVIKRIKTLFGDKYGIEIQSELGEGTQITVRLPAMREIQ